MAQAQINFDLPVTFLSDIQGTSDPDLSLTPANPGQGRKRKSTVSHSVAGADLRRRRIHRADCRNNLPSLTLSPLIEIPYLNISPNDNAISCSDSDAIGLDFLNFQTFVK